MVLEASKSAGAKGDVPKRANAFPELNECAQLKILNLEKGILCFVNKQKIPLLTFSASKDTCDVVSANEIERLLKELFQKGLFYGKIVRF